MILYWVREVVGWVLLALGLLIFGEVYNFCLEHHILEAGALTIVGAFVFRGGLHLLKVAVAARVCLQAQDRLYPKSPAPPLSMRPTRPAVRLPGAPPARTNGSGARRPA